MPITRATLRQCTKASTRWQASHASISRSNLHERKASKDQAVLKSRMNGTQSTHGPDELGAVWQQFLAGKFSATTLEAARAEYEDLKDDELADEEDQLTIPVNEYLDAVARMKNGKAVGPDGVAAEVFKHSKLAREELYCFLQQVWRYECVPRNLVLGMFVMIHKKGSCDELSNYRALCMLNHAYKILSICLLKRIVAETEGFLSDWQAGFRGGRGCRDNTLLLRVIYDNIIRNKKHCVVTFIDFAAAFDSVSHKFLDEALAKAGAKRKTRALLRAIYQAAQGAVQIQDETGKVRLSQTFTVRRGVVQGDIISPILFILALDQVVQEADTGGQGVSVGEIKELRVLGYADDAAMASITVDEMTQRLTKFADAALARADMQTKLSKTWSQHVRRQEKLEPASEEEILAKEASYDHLLLRARRRLRGTFQNQVWHADSHDNVSLQLRQHQ